MRSGPAAVDRIEHICVGIGAAWAPGPANKLRAFAALSTTIVALLTIPPEEFGTSDCRRHVVRERILGLILVGCANGDG